MAEITIRVSDKVLRIAGILLGATILFLIFFYLLSSGFFVPKYQLNVYFPEASDVTLHSPVILDGVQIGSVNAIKLAEESAGPQRRIELVLRVEKHYQDAIRSDSTATLLTEGLLGGRFVEVERGYTGSVISPGGEIPAVPVLALKNTSNAVEKFGDCLQQLAGAVEKKAPAPADPTSKAQH
jgi:phospholipid/cholesterol/gamma-HCH transport system substrate-binding protein